MPDSSSTTDSGEIIRTTYRNHRKAGADPCAAYSVTVRALIRHNPDLGAFQALVAVKEALGGEPELGLVDCGSDQIESEPVRRAS